MFVFVFFCTRSSVLLTQWGRVTHICVGNLTITGSDNGLSPGRRQAITWTNVGILLIGPLGTNFSGILIGIQTFSFKKLHLKTSSAKWRLFCLGLNELIMDSWLGNCTSRHAPTRKLLANFKFLRRIEIINNQPCIVREFFCSQNMNNDYLPMPNHTHTNIYIYIYIDMHTLELNFHTSYFVIWVQGYSSDLRDVIS